MSWWRASANIDGKTSILIASVITRPFKRLKLLKYSRPFFIYIYIHIYMYINTYTWQRWSSSWSLEDLTLLIHCVSTFGRIPEAMKPIEISGRMGERWCFFATLYCHWSQHDCVNIYISIDTVVHLSIMMQCAWLTNRACLDLSPSEYNLCREGMLSRPINKTYTYF